MNSLKNIFIQHGEKIVVAIVALLCGYSLLGILSRNSKELELPDGTHKFVDQEDIKQKIDRVRKHLTSQERVKPVPTADKTSLALARNVLSASGIVPQATLEWYPYVQSPLVGAPQIFFKPETPVGLNIPADYRTRFGNPEDVRVFASVDNIMVVAKDSKYLNFPEPGSRRMLLWRKAIGSGKEDLNSGIRASMMTSPRGETVAKSEDSGDAATATAATAGTPGATASTAGVSGWGVAVAADKPAAGGRDTQATEDATGGIEAYKERLQKADLRAYEDLKAVCTSATVVDTGWELVTPTMYALKVEPTQEVIKKLIEGGLSPDLVEMTAAEEAEWKKREEEKKKGAAKPAEVKPVKPATRTDWSEIVAPKVEARPATTAAAATTTEPAVESPRYYVYIDRNIQQNMVYRYGLIASVQPRMPDKELLAKPEYLGWDIYAEVCGIGGVPPAGGDFALPARMVKDVFETKMTAASKGVLGVHLDFLSCYQPATAATAPAAPAGRTPAADSATKPAGAGADAEAAKTNNEPQVKRKELRNEKGTLTPLGKAYRDREPCYSDFVYTDLVLTPKEFDFDVRQVSRLDAQSVQGTIRVQKVEKDGTVKSATFPIVFKPLPNSPTWNDLLAKDIKGTPLWPAKILSLQEVYGKFTDLKPVMIGEKRGADDFASGWGIVDVRPYLTKGKRFLKDAKTGDWKAAPDLAPREGLALIIAEVNPPKGQPRRFLRLYRPGPASTNENQRYEYEYDWEPELTKKIDERTKRMSESGTAPAAPASSPKNN